MRRSFHEGEASLGGQAKLNAYWRRVRRRAPVAAAIAVIGLMVLSGSSALAHPLGNFSVNHQTRVKVSRDRVDLLYILDQAEIPTLQERKLSDREITKLKLDEVRRDLWVIVDQKRVSPRLSSRPRLSFPTGQGGLRLTRLELPLRLRAHGVELLEVQDRTFGERVGWVDVVSLPGRGTRVATYVSPDDPTDGLRKYDGITLRGVPDQVIGKFFVAPGKGSLVDLGTGSVYGPRDGPPLSPSSPSADAKPSPTTGGGSSEVNRPAGDGFASVFERAAQGEGIFFLMLLAAFAWGSFHALSPGHGKAMVAAYLVGTRGTARHAVMLGGIVTITHTIGVFALGLVTLLLAQYILPEDLYPWLNLVSGLLIVAVGFGVLRSRLRWREKQRRTSHAGGDSGAHGHGHSHDHHHHDDKHHHDHLPEATWKGLAAMGISAGIIPCPTALVVMLAAITQHQVGLGLLLIVVFSVGLAATLTTLGLAVVYAKRLMAGVSSRLSFSGRFASAAPAVSTLLILALGVVLTAKAMPDVV